jgi:hypothetical protein
LRLLGAINRVAGRTDRPHNVAIPYRIQRLAEPADVNVDSPRLDKDVMAPDGVEQLLA